MLLRCWVASLLLVSSALAGEALGLRLESSGIVLDIDSATGAFTRIHNKITNDAKTLRDEPFRLMTTLGEVTGRNYPLRRSSHDAGRSATFEFEGEGLAVKVTYRLADGNAAAVRKFVSVTNRTEKDVTLFRVDMFDWIIPAAWPSGYPHSYYPGGFTDIHFHRAGTWYHNPINLFLRDEAGGWYVGMENPIFDASFRCLRKVYPTTVKVGFNPRWVLKPGETFEADPGFLGVYKQEKVYRVRQARAYFDGRERVPFEILDWGEVWAMQRYMENIMPAFDTQAGRYPMAYWGYADPGRLGKISRKKENAEPLSAEEAAMLKHFGGVPFDFHEQEIWHRLTPATVKFYKQVIDDAALLGHYDTLVIPNMMAGHTGWFVSEEQKKEQAAVDALSDDWFGRPAYPLWKEVADYAMTKGMGMFTLELAGRLYRADKPEWGYLTADGRRSEMRCYANTAYVDWYTNRMIEALSTHPLRIWQWDEGWMGAVEGFLGQDGHCYDAGHGHLPGNVHYHQFRNVMSTVGRLKQRHPGVRMVIISGLIPGMPWVMKCLDGDSHTGSFEQAAWFDHNDLFLPSLKSHREGGIHWIISRGSSAVEPVDTTNWYTMLEDPQALAAYREHWDRWMKWTEAHLDYLRVRRDLFVPGEASRGLEGSAHCLGDRGFIFLHHAGKAPVIGRIGLNHLLGLEKTERIKLRQLYPEERDLGVYPYGYSLNLVLESGQTKMFEVMATTDEVADQLPKAPANLLVFNAFLDLSDVPKLIEPADLWPATPLPGKANMPGF